MNIKDFLINSKRFYASRPAIIDRGKVLTYQQLYNRTCQCASALRKAGVQEGDRVAVGCRNCAEYLEIMFACSMIGAVPCLINWRIAPAVMLDMVHEADARILFLSNTENEAIEYFRAAEGSGSGKLIVVKDEGTAEADYDQFLATGEAELVFAEPAPEATGLILFTSGTTSRAKGVMLSNRALMTQIHTSVICSSWPKGERFLCMSPICHSISLSVMAAFCVSGTLVLCPSTYLKDCDKIFGLLEVYGITRVSMVPTLIERLVRYAEENKVRNTTLRVIGYGAAPMNTRLIERCSKVFSCSFHQGYGMTETYGTVTALLAEDHYHPELLRSVGRPMTGCSIRIMGEDGKELPVNENGEIWIKTDTLMQGYMGKPELTAKVITDGWYHSGDIGYLNPEGYLFLTGRKSDMIITGGENVFPDEVEECILNMSDEIAAVSVVGVPDAEWGEAIAAAVVLRSGAAVTERMIMDHCKNSIGGFKKPKKILFVDVLPTTETGKVSRKKVKELFNK